MDNSYSILAPHNKLAFKEGLRDGLPIGLGYFAVSFSLGVVAKNVGLSVFQGFLVSLLCNASAGEYVGFTLIAANAAYVELALATLIANARYLLMGCAMSQRLSPNMPFFHRYLMAFDLTDELFGIAIARKGDLNPYYTYGSVVTAGPFWAIGTAAGVFAGNVLPANIVSALSVALFGMFIAIIIPPAKKDKIVAGLVAVSFASSYLITKLDCFASISDGTRVVVLTLLIASAGAILFPRKGNNEQ